MKSQFQYFIIILVLSLSTNLPKCLAEDENTEANTEPPTTTTVPIVATEEISDNEGDVESTTIVLNPTDGVDSETSLLPGSILIAPTSCPKGQKLDHRGICRKVSVFSG